MKKTRIICALLLITSSLGSTFSNTITYASPNIEFVSEDNELVIDSSNTVWDVDNENQLNIEKVVEETIGNVNIKSSEYLYNLDDSSDFIYFEFDDGGYAVFLKQTMELLEYSPEGRLEYSNDDSKKYYGGPNLYLMKTDGQFVDIRSGKSTHISDATAESYSNEMREMLNQNYNHRKNKQVEKNYDYNTVGKRLSLSIDSSLDNDAEAIGNKPKLDDSSYIKISPSSQGAYIPNYMYFLSDPIHGENTTGTCGAVAAQLLLSYHNYYSDRRIIANKYLNGSSASSERHMHLNYCEDPMSMTTYTLGTRGLSEDGSDVTNSYFAKIVDEIPASATTSQVKNGIKTILKERNDELDEDISYVANSKVGFLLSAVDTSGVRAEIDEGRPAIILMQDWLGGSNHYVVAYGYQNYTYPDSDETYSGFVTHFGWGSDYLNVWINSAWCYSYITLEINHTHEYDEYVGPIGNTGGYEYKCGECGHRTDAILNIDSTDRYTERKFSIAAGYFKDYYVNFEVEGNKVIQTFGSKDTVLELYSANGTLLIGSESTDDDGYSLNALLSYNFSANTEYIVRIKFFSSSVSGDVKLAIVPTYAHDYYEKAYGPYATGTVTWSLSKNNVALFRYKFNASDDVVFTMNSNTDTYLYIIDPTSTDLMTRYNGTNTNAKNLCDDDSGEGVQAKLTKTVVANKEYLVIISFYNPNGMSGDFSIRTSYS